MNQVKGVGKSYPFLETESLKNIVNYCSKGNMEKGAT